MEFFFYTFLTTISWACSLSCLLPFAIALKFSKPLRDLWFSWCFVKVVGYLLGEALGKMRKRGMFYLRDHLPERRNNAEFEILEIGFGGGLNLPFYPENSNLTALDVNESFLKYFKESAKQNPQVNCKKIVIGSAEDMHEFDDDSFDVVVSTWVLCSVQNVPAALKEIKRVLRPGGKFLFLEHMTYPSFTWQALLQRLMNPLWKLYFDGCHINRKTSEEVVKTGFSNVVSDIHYPKDVWLYVRPMVLGVATK